MKSIVHLLPDWLPPVNSVLSLSLGDRVWTSLELISTTLLNLLITLNVFKAREFVLMRSELTA